MTIAELATGTIFAGYQIDGVAGEGGMGRVYRATEIALQRPVALKLIAEDFAGDRKFRERFQRESMLAASISEGGGSVTWANIVATLESRRNALLRASAKKRTQASE